jgi:phage-related protein
MRNVSDLSLKPVEWIGSSLNDLKDFPDEVQQVVGYALYIEMIYILLLSHLKGLKMLELWKLND